uniref:Uncharacterized protein n=1 Tax=Kalanchoe fedtschenkoi TaxID=63787 RepID=A0A7N1A1C3_KALFE
MRLMKKNLLQQTMNSRSPQIAQKNLTKRIEIKHVIINKFISHQFPVHTIRQMAMCRKIYVWICLFEDV